MKKLTIEELRKKNLTALKCEKEMLQEEYYELWKEKQELIASILHLQNIIEKGEIV